MPIDQKNGEWAIETEILRNPGKIGYPDATGIRNVRIHTDPSFGRVDVLLLPESGSHRVALIEAKRSNAIDADGKCVGQLLKYYSAVRQLGETFVNRYMAYARANPVKAFENFRLTPKMVFGVSRESDASEMLMDGARIQKHEIGLFVAIDGDARQSLPLILGSLNELHGFEIGLIVIRNGVFESLTYY